VESSLRTEALARFNRYAQGYELPDGKIKLKVAHMVRVGAIIRDLAEQLGWNARDCDLAYICGLFHDIGRFEQVAQYGTFTDGVSVNHAELGCEVIVADGLLKFLTADDEERILTAILNHNRLLIEPSVPEGPTLEMCHLIRDADKVDIFRVVAEDDLIDTVGVGREALEADCVSDYVYECCMNDRCVDYSKRETYLDRLVAKLTYFYDMHFDASVRLAFEQGWYSQPYKTMQFQERATSKRVGEVVSHVEGYVKLRIASEHSS